MAEVPGRATAQSFSADVRREVGASPLHWNDKCFLCGVEIGEAEPRQFYQGRAAMVLCHTGCLNVMNTNGGRPVDYHTAMGNRAVAAAGLDPSPPYTGPGWLDFPDLAAMVAYARERGDIPTHVKVTVGGKTVVQAGE
jgi:hypothetical protein